MKMIKGTIKKNIIAGLLVTVPVSLTYIVLKFVITRIDALVVPVVSKIIGEKAMENFNGYFVPGMGFLILIFFIFFIGLLATNFFGKKLFSFGELVLRKIPIVRVIYITIKKVVDTVSQSNESTFEKMALITYPRAPLKTLGIIVCDTPDAVSRNIEEPSVNVFVPTSPNPTTGFVIAVPIKDVDFLKMTVEEGLKMIISFGVVAPK
ncbi:MAG: DUF502 domain-containing protein [Nitrospina sp.]|jgi:uncharacterized membrane protein|nr:DUF502 domain-containing protein [Nitrospina sp.]MDG1844493.1 DUF502 domain-containing protein [Nitrospinaceae bacterium]MBT4127852.1 DUF502 domain-containing protein [Nitrospina sp.]MBT5257837.1 DUF502 domain-containing protein [Nitrospina sp.]MBT6296880.1 DUF502 domain-containing protein [Nitrospina sp.]